MSQALALVKANGFGQLLLKTPTPIPNSPANLIRTLETIGN
jgi:hypothetical protein